jgi:hypothetical protein
MEPATLRQKLLPILAGLGLYLFTTGISYAAFNFLSTPPDIEFKSPIPAGEGGELFIDPAEPKTEACPLNGAYYTKTERKVWEKRRPLAVMIENHTEARPQSGLSNADVVYEAVAEGGITRFLALYLCDAVAKDRILGPIRSARTYYLDWASEYGETPLYVHVGGANLPGPANALGQIQQYGWGGRYGNDLNQFSIGYPTFWRDYERIGHTVATEHTMYSTTEKLWAEGEDRGWTNKDLDGIDWQQVFEPWTFSDEEKEGEAASEIHFGFWEGYKEYDVTWKYNSQAGLYERFNGGGPLKDLNNDQQITSKVVIVQFMVEKGPIDELKHLLYQTTGSGKALVFQDGKVIEATWKKSTRTDRTKFFTKTGKEIVFSPGKIWIEIIPSGNSVDY